MGNVDFIFGLTVLQLGVALFCANVLFLRQKHQRVYVPLALFFAVISYVLIADVIEILQEEDVLFLSPAIIPSITLPFIFLQPFFFWLYVRALVSEDGITPIKHKTLHAVPIILGVVTAVLLSTLPSRLLIDDTVEWVNLSARVKFIILLLTIAGVVINLQIAVYLVLVVRLLANYRTRLKNLFATTENRELKWIWWIAIVVSIYLFFYFAVLIIEISETHFLPTSGYEMDVIDDIIELSIIWVIGIWGLRQQPGLSRDVFEDDEEQVDDIPSATKYERSALTKERANRISRKIETAMEKDLLYRNPNLSLWDLAKHIGVTSNYVSQTLNTTLGNNFFDYVNKWRIKDAAVQLRETDETILTITYDVGFNSRSSFYKAFKREMGMTPTALRANK